MIKETDEFLGLLEKDPEAQLSRDEAYVFRKIDDSFFFNLDHQRDFSFNIKREPS